MKRAVSVLKKMANMYIDVQIPIASAAFSYLMTLALFPILICLYAMLGRYFPTVAEIQRFLTGILPEDTITSLLDYIEYISANHSVSMIIFAVTSMALTSAAAFRCIDDVMGRMRGRRRFEGFFEVIFSFIFSIAFLIAVYAAGIMMVTGKWFIETMDKLFKYVNISASWTWMRFVLLFALLFVMIVGVYKITSPSQTKVRILPGAAAASFFLVGVSIVFSYFIGASLRYHVVYGSLASVMIMMLWIYTCGVILFMGNALNISLEMVEKEGLT